jgi:hypothetical protein
MYTREPKWKFRVKRSGRIEHYKGSGGGEMQQFRAVPNLPVDGDEFTSGFLGLDWFPLA